MTKKEIEKEITVLELQNKEFARLLKQMDKKVTGHLRLWFFLPFFGFIIYQNILYKRKTNTSYAQDAIKVKTEIIKNEYQILKLKKELEKIDPSVVTNKKK